MFEHTIFELNWTFWIFLVMFLGFMKALNAVFVKPVGAVIAKREAKLRDDAAAGQACRQQATELLEGYERDLREVRATAQALINDATTGVAKERAAELKRVQDEGQAQVAGNKKAIDAERVTLSEQLIDEEKGLVELIVQKLLGNSVPVQLDHAVIKHALEESR